VKYSIAIGTDHRGFALKQFILTHPFEKYEIKWHDVGTFSAQRTDYPPFAAAVCHALLTKKAEWGIVICSNGIGVSIAANRFKHIYCGLVWNVEVTRQAREDDNINVLALPAEYVTFQQALLIIDAWLNTTFKEGRYAQRLQQIDTLP
jgi:ribose 5-phosphate isomerase B